MPNNPIAYGQGDRVYQGLKSGDSRQVSSALRGDPVVNKLEQSTRSSVPLSFPSDLFSDNGEHNYGIKFEIWDTDGQALSERRKFTSTIENMVKDATQKSGENQQDTIDPVQLISKGVSLVASLGAGLFSSFTPLLNAVSSKEAEFVPGGRVSFVEAATGLGGGTSLRKTVYLFLPGGLKFSDKFDYEDADMSGIDYIRGIKGAMGLGNSEAQGEIMRKIGMGAMKIADDIAEGIGGKDFIQNYAKATTRQVENPFLVHLFKGVQRRSFTFDFVMVPRSEAEAVVVREIVQTFRQYAHPSRTAGGRFLNFPAEFNLTFLYKNSEDIIAVPKIKKCALTSINIDYGESSIFTGHKPDFSGKVNATQVKMTLEFAELEMLARQEIEGGY